MAEKLLKLSKNEEQAPRKKATCSFISYKNDIY